MRGLVIIWVCVAAACVCEGRTITVDDDGPADFNNIQAAINDANEGDTIIVTQGRYYENIHFAGKNIVLRSTDPTDSSVVEKTVIDGRFLDSVVMFAGTESPACVLAGFTITCGLAHAVSYNEGRGGGIYGNGTLATIEHNVISLNLSASYSPVGLGRGGGLDDCDGTIRYNVIRNNKAYGDMGLAYGGGLYACDGLIQDNVIAANYSDGAGGGLSDCHGSVEHNTVWDNDAHGWGGGLFYCNGSVRDNLIGANWATWGGGGLSHCRGTVARNEVLGNGGERGGGMYYDGSPGSVVNQCTFARNTGQGGAVYVPSGSLVLHNCIVWGNQPDEIYVWGGSVGVTYSDIKGGCPGTGNIDADPCFADPNNGDYHLKSQGGRYDPNSQAWVQDDVTSPCIDAADPMSPIGLEPFPSGGIVNMGAYGGTVEASKSYFGEPVCEVVVAGDVNGDCTVNFLDFRIMALHWLWQE
jgi:hypothetical protein